jgi:DNA polymerase III alpha subunit
MNTENYTTLYSFDTFKELVYTNNFDKIFSLTYEDSNDVKKFNNYATHFNYNTLNDKKENYISLAEFDRAQQKQWLMPAEYINIDLLDNLIKKCTSRSEIDRVNLEYKKFEKNNLIPLLHYIVFLIDNMRENNIVWGVGRGSSVASFILFLIGIHKINPLKYNLDFDEFLK